MHMFIHFMREGVSGTLQNHGGSRFELCTYVQVERRCCQFQKVMLTAVHQAQLLLIGAAWPKAFVLFFCV